MSVFDNTPTSLFNGPICPTCATEFDREQYDDVDDCACCMNCGTTYRIPDEFHPLHPEDRLEHDLLDLQGSAAIEQFRADAEQIAAVTIRETAGASYELYARRLTDALDPYIGALDPALRPHALKIATYHGYIEDADESEAGFGPGLCSLSGIDETYCHCGRHP